MKKIFLLFSCVAGFSAMAQQKTISQAIINTKTTIVVPEGEDENVPPPPPQGGDGPQIVIRNGMAGGETNSVTYLKNDLVKTVINSEMGRSSTIRDNAKQTTTTLMEMMGNKTGFVATDAEMEESRKKMDSMMQSRNPADAARNSTPPVVEVVNIEETKKIAGFDCKKAMIITTRTSSAVDKDGQLVSKTTSDSSVVWYCPDFKLQGLSSTGGSMGGMFSMFTRGTGLSGLEKLNGFPMMYEMNMRRGRKMLVEVTKIDSSKEIKDKEFEVPKDFDLKPIKDMQNGNGTFQIRIGG
jgi:hypothetical protein